MTTLPLLGAAMPLGVLEVRRDWILADQRDLELQDFIPADVLGGDWQPQVDRARALLDGYTGRLGIHGPFWGLHLANPDPEVRTIVTKRMSQGLTICGRSAPRRWSSTAPTRPGTTTASTTCPARPRRS